VLYHLLPANLGQAYRQLSGFGFIVLYMLMFTGALTVIEVPVIAITKLLLLPGMLV
jgi:hypothetical protein